MPRYLVTYYDGGNMPHNPESMAKVRDAFIAWAQKAGPALVDPGAPVGSKRAVSSAGTAGNAEGAFSGWSVVEAADLEGAVQLLADHPLIGRGGVLEVSEPATF